MGALEILFIIIIIIIIIIRYCLVLCSSVVIDTAFLCVWHQVNYMCSHSQERVKRYLKVFSLTEKKKLSSFLQH